MSIFTQSLFSDKEKVSLLRGGLISFQREGFNVRNVLLQLHIFKAHIEMSIQPTIEVLFDE